MRLFNAEIGYDDFSACVPVRKFETDNTTHIPDDNDKFAASHFTSRERILII